MDSVTKIERKFKYDLMLNRDLFVLLSLDKGILFSSNSIHEIINNKDQFSGSISHNEGLFLIERTVEDLKNNSRFKA